MDKKCKTCGVRHKAGHEHFKTSGADAIKKGRALVYKKMHKAIDEKKSKLKIKASGKAAESLAGKLKLKHKSMTGGFPTYKFPSSVGASKFNIKQGGGMYRNPNELLTSSKFKKTR